MAAIKLVYLASEYPGISHTFIFREIQTLRSMGFEVATASIRKPEHLSRMTGKEHDEALRTFYIKDSPFTSLFRCHYRLFKRHPWRCLCMLTGALRFGRRGPKSLFKGLAYFAEAGMLIDWMQGEKESSHVHVHFANPAATVAMIAALYKAVDFSMSVHGPDIFYNVEENLLAEKVKRARFVRCISHYCQSQLMRLVPHSCWSKFSIVRCGVDPSVFLPRPEPTNAAAEILCVGRLVPAKGQHILIEACSGLKAKGIPFHLTFVGGGDDRDSLADLARRSGIADRVTFTGAIGQDDVHAYYDRADVFVLASFAEGVPVVLMEAMAKEIPCISTRITGIPELIDDGLDGLLVAPSNAAELSEKLAVLLGDPVMRRTLGRRGREKILERYNLDQNCKGMAELFTKGAKMEAC